MKQVGVRIGLILLIAIFIASGWYLLSPLFLNRTVNEASPFVFPHKDEVGMIMPPDLSIGEVVAARIVTPPTDAATSTATAIMEAIEQEQSAQATAPASGPAITGPTVLGQGRFVDGDGFHKGSGLATLYALADGTYLLRFEEFTTTNGPDLRVFLSPNAVPTDHGSLGEYLEVGTLKGNIGDQNYTLPAGFDPSGYKSVVIYCLPFQVIFATATLETL
jgi:hypothetical protein